MNIFELSTELISLEQLIIEQGGEISPELENALKIAENELQTKAVNYGHVIRKIEAETGLIENEIKRLQAMKKSRENAVERLKTIISGAMKLHGIEKIDTPLLKLSFRKSESVNITDLEQIPLYYIKIKKEADKMAIKSAIKEIDIPGAELVVNQNLQIR